eukprot:1150320-Pelagomonas_calceolata.AAC.7
MPPSHPPSAHRSCASPSCPTGFLSGGPVCRSSPAQARRAACSTGRAPAHHHARTRKKKKNLCQPEGRVH